MLIECFKTYVQPHAPRRSLLLGAVIACITIMTMRSWLDAGPTASYAGEVHIKSTGPLAAGLLTNVQRIDVRHDGQDRWDLVLDVRWTCPSSRLGVESTTGALVVWSSEQPDRRLEIPCQLMSAVTPGSPVTCELSTMWDDVDPTHELIRRADPETLRTLYRPDQTVLAARSTPLGATQDRDQMMTYSSRPKVGSKPFASRNAPASSFPR